MSWHVSPWVYPVCDSLGFLDLGGYILRHFREVFDYYLKYFPMSFPFDFFFWDAYFYYYRRQRAGSITSSIGADYLEDYSNLIDSCLCHSEKVSNLDMRNVLISYVMYQVVLASALTFFAGTAEEKTIYGAKYKELCKRYMKEHCLSKRVRAFYSVYKVLGYPVAAQMAARILARKRTR